MIFKVVFTKRFLKSFDKLDRNVQKRTFSWIENNLSSTLDPRLRGKSLEGKLSGFWRYKIGEYRIICNKQDDQLLVLLIEIGHKKQVDLDDSRKL